MSRHYNTTLIDNIHTVVLYHILHLNWLFEPPYLIFLTYGSWKKGEIHLRGQGMWSSITPTPCLPPPQGLRMDHMNLLGSKFTIFSIPNSCNIANDTHFTTDICMCRMLSVTHKQLGHIHPEPYVWVCCFVQPVVSVRTPWFNFLGRIYIREIHICIEC